MTEADLNPDGRVPVEVLAEEYLERRSRGEAVTVEDYVAKHPDLAEDIREVFPALEALKSLSKEWKRSVTDNNQSGPELPFQLGEYRLERQIGRGGMGIVYEAEHTSLRRRVAIKLLRMFSLNTSSDIERFHKEAQAAARLHHTNIVPVFDFGEEDGFHYIAMQLIQGEGLDSIVDRLRLQTAASNLPTVPKNNVLSAATRVATPPFDQMGGTDHDDLEFKRLHYSSPGYWNEVAAIGIQAANGLNYAHSQGIIHRDIKPANLLLDANRVVWVADFGLARQDQDGKPTQSGILSGTLRYLAPEHFHGFCDARTDQYGLGLSLYELVTLRPATGDSGSHAEVIRRITEAKVTPPRQLNPDIPRDLETIILKAIAAQPDHRFSSCKALAEDLQRFVEGRPIQSRPVTRIERLWQWAKRYPALATATATSATLLVLVAVVAMIGYRAEHEQRQRAEATSDYAMQALNTVFDEYGLTPQSAEFLADVSISTPVLSQESADMLERLLPIFDRLAELDDQSADVRLRATEARKRVGDIHQRLGDFVQAIDAYGLAAKKYDALEFTETTNTALRKSDIFNSIGTCEIMLGHAEESRHWHATALSQLEPLSASANPEVTFQLARTHFLLNRRLRPGESPNVVFSGESPRRRPPVGSGRFGPGPPMRRAPKPNRQDSDHAHLQSAIQLIESLSDEQKNEPRCRHLLAMCLMGLGPEFYSGRATAAKDAEERALSILQQLAADYPAVSEYHHAYVSALAGINTQQADAIYFEDLPIVESRLQLATTSAEELVARHPYVPEYSLTLIHAHNKLAHVLERRGMERQTPECDKLLSAAVENYAAAARLQSGLAKRFPQATAYQVWLKEFENSARSVQAELNRTAK